MDEVDGNSRDASTDGSSGSVSHMLQELQLSHAEALSRHHSSWSSPHLPGDVTYSQHLGGRGFSWNERTDVDRTNDNIGPAVASVGDNQFEHGAGSAVRLGEISNSKLPRHDGTRYNNESILSHFHAASGEESKLSKQEEMPLHWHSVSELQSKQQKMPLHWHSGTELRSEVFYRDDELVHLKSSLHSGTFQPRPDSRDSLAFELRSDLNSSHENDLEQNYSLPKLQSQLSSLHLRPDMEPAQQMDLREHLPKPHPTDRSKTNTERNAQMPGQSACQLSVTGSFVQQCSDMDDFRSYGQHYQESYEAPGNNSPHETRDVFNPNFRTDHLEHVIQTQDELLRSRDQEVLELKEANHRQSMFIEKVLRDKRLLETAVVEQARLLMLHDAQRPNADPVHRPVLSAAGGAAFDSQLYETQLATYKEDFENERKEKHLIKASADSLMEQLQTALNELRTAQDKLKRTEDELERYKNPYRATYQPYLQMVSRSPNSTASSSSSSAAASAQSKTPLYRKPDQLEPDRANNTILSRSCQMDRWQLVMRKELGPERVNRT